MKATPFEFRHRVAIIAVFYTLAFAVPWYLINDVAGSRTWLALPSLVTRAGWLPLSEATVFVTVFALVAGVAGTVLRVWGTAHLGAAAMTSSSMIAGQVVASGPYRHLRNPLYLGTWLVTVPIALLMPLAGAIFTFVALSVFLLRIIGGEESHLVDKLGESYNAYRTRVPRLVPSAFPAVPSVMVSTRWLRSVVAESFAVSFTVCFALFAWRYNAQWMERCLLVCFGASLIAQAMSGPAKRQRG
jgi:protein-S-isoprenylcysteine O-methyltransferase Ste14